MHCMHDSLWMCTGHEDLHWCCSNDCSAQGIGCSDNLTGKLLLLRSILKVICSVHP